MPVQWQTVSIPFAQGIDTKSDPKQLPPGKLVSLVNGELDGVNRIKKRRGYTARSGTDTDGNAVSADYLTSDGSCAYIWDGADVYMWAGQWRKIGIAPPIHVTTSAKLDTTDDPQSGANLGNDFALSYALSSSSSNQYSGILDLSTGRTANLTGSSHQCYAVVRYDGKLRMIHGSSSGSGDITVYDWDPTTRTFSSFVAGTGFVAGDVIAVHEGDETATFIAYRRTSDTNILRVTTSTTHSTAVTGSSVASNKLEALGYDGTYIYLFSRRGTSPNYLINCDSYAVSDLSSNFTGSTIEGSMADIIVNVGAVADGGLVHVYYSNSDNNNSYIRYNTIDSSGSVGTPADFVRGTRLTGRPFVHSGVRYIPGGHNNDPLVIGPNSQFILDENGHPVCILEPRRSFNFRTDEAHYAPQEDSTDSDAFYFAHSFQGYLNTTFGRATDGQGTAITRLDFSPDSPPPVAVLNGSTFIGAGLIYVATTSMLINAPIWLDPGSNAVSAGTGGSLPNGTYSWKTVYVWRDEDGNVHRSAPSAAVSLTLTGSNDEGLLDVATLRQVGSNDVARRGNLYIELYRTLLNGSVYYFCESYTNDRTIDAYTSLGGSGTSGADSTISGNATLYTSSGEVPTGHPPPADWLVSWKDRLFLGHEDEVWFTKKAVDGIGPEFSDFLILKTPTKKTVAACALDDQLLIFSDKDTFVTRGDGPNDAAAGGRFFGPTKLATGVGCVDRGSVTVCPLGAVFKSAKGVYLMTRSLEAQYIGAPVEAYNNETVLSAVTLADRNEVRLTTANRIMVWDYFANQWATHTLGTSTPKHGALEDTTYLLLRADGVVMEESTTAFDDGGNSYAMSAKTGWLHPDGPQGYFRARRFGFLAEKLSDHTITVKVRYDYDDTVVQTETFNAATGILAGDDLYQFRARFDRQKCTAVQLEFIESAQSGTEEGLSISDLTLEVAAKGGISRLLSGKTL